MEEEKLKKLFTDFIESLNECIDKSDYAFEIKRFIDQNEEKIKDLTN